MTPSSSLDLHLSDEVVTATCESDSLLLEDTDRCLLTDFVAEIASNAVQL